MKLRHLAILALIPLSQNASALDQIIRPEFSVRDVGMGDVRLTTGLYEDNFFGNPARATANPHFRVTTPIDVSMEGSPNLSSTIQTFTGNGDVGQKLSNTAGSNNHGRIQTEFPAVFIPAGQDNKLAIAFGILASTQFDVDLRQNFSVSPQAITDIGPALTVARKFLADDALSVGTTLHATYRLASDPSFSFIDLIQGKSLSPLQSGGDGAMIDDDIGATYNLPWNLWGFNTSAAFAVNNILGGGYSNLPIHIVKSGLLPPAQPRTYGFGGSMTRDLWGSFKKTVFALEFTDIGNNPNGGLFRLVHIGAETHYGVLAFRTGVNEGYPTAGLGLDLRVFTLDFAYYTEEMGLNPGDLPDHRLALKLAIQVD